MCRPVLAQCKHWGVVSVSDDRFISFYCYSTNITPGSHDLYPPCGYCCCRVVSDTHWKSCGEASLRFPDCHHLRWSNIYPSLSFNMSHFPEIILCRPVCWLSCVMIHEVVCSHTPVSQAQHLKCPGYDHFHNLLKNKQPLTVVYVLSYVMRYIQQQ